MLAHDKVALAARSRSINGMFCLSTIGTTGSFLPHNDIRLPPGAPTIILNGKTYTNTRPINKPDQSLFYMLYDTDSMFANAASRNLPRRITEPWFRVIQRENSLYHTLENFAAAEIPEATLELEEEMPGADVAALIYGTNRSNFKPRTVQYRKFATAASASAGKTHSVSTMSPLYEILHYVLFYPTITSTPEDLIHVSSLAWGPNNVLKLSLREWTQRRLLAEHRFRDIDRLGCEFVCDAAVRILESRMKYVGKAKGAEREREAGFFEEASELDDDEEGTAKLPASFVGSTAWTTENCADALCIVRKTGRPHFLLTVTFNREWEEVQAELRGSNTQLDPNLTVRIFHHRLQKLMKTLSTCFGSLVYSIMVIEFQKRGHPHAHLILRVAPDLPFSKIDAVVTGELARGTSAFEKRARELQLKHMQHPRNHLDGQYSRCNKNGSCVYGFEQPLRARTTVDDHGRVLYRRREEEDRWTATTIPFLLVIWEGHLHVDVVFTTDVVLYVFKGTIKSVRPGKHMRFILGGTFVRFSLRPYIHADLSSPYQSGTVQVDISHFAKPISAKAGDRVLVNLAIIGLEGNTLTGSMLGFPIFLSNPSATAAGGAGISSDDGSDDDKSPSKKRSGSLSKIKISPKKNRSSSSSRSTSSAIKLKVKGPRAVFSDDEERKAKNKKSPGKGKGKARRISPSPSPEHQPVASTSKIAGDESGDDMELSQAEEDDGFIVPDDAPVE